MAVLASVTVPFASFRSLNFIAKIADISFMLIVYWFSPQDALPIKQGMSPAMKRVSRVGAAFNSAQMF